jgi:hypothetical protein
VTEPKLENDHQIADLDADSLGWVGIDKTILMWSH